MQEICLNIYNCIDKTGKIIINKILGIFNIQISDKQWNNFMQFFKFGLVGLFNSIVSYLIYTIAIYNNIHHLIANFLAFIISVLSSFYLNNKFVFKEDNKKRSKLKALLKVYISYATTGIFLNSIFLTIFIDVIGISKYIAPIIVMIINIPINFLLNKLWAFNTSKDV